MTWDDLLAAANGIRARAVEADPSLAPLALAGLGWATVDHERAMDELDVALGATSSTRWTALDRDGLLGASAWLREPSVGRPAIVLLEPDTEGRLAASLARFGEGVAAVYLGAASLGPRSLGRARLAPGGPAWGPHVIVIENGDAEVPLV